MEVCVFCNFISIKKWGLYILGGRVIVQIIIITDAADDEQAALRDAVQLMDGNIPHEIFFKQECIGQGAFGKVFKGI